MECGQKYVRKHMLLLHYKQRHGDLASLNTEKSQNKNMVQRRKRRSRKGCDEFKGQYKMENDFFVCLICPEDIEQNFRTKYQVNSHIRSVHYRLRLLCAECGAEYKRRDKIIQHYRNNHADCVVPTVFKSTMLSQPLNVPSKTKLIGQAKTPLFDYKNTYRKLDDGSYICLLCPEDDRRKFKSCDSTNHHVKYSHYNLRYICTECGWKTTGQRELRLHYRTKHDMEPPLTLESTSTIHRSIYEDMYQNAQEANPISEKEEQFRNLIYSKEHYRKEETCYVCLLCSASSPATFPMKHHLGRHIKLEHFRFRFLCTVCSTEFKCRYELAQHYKAHHKDTPVPEEPQTTVLEKPLVDIIVPKPTKLSDRYTKIEDNCYSCNICSRTFKQIFSVRGHINKDHLGRRLRCDLCTKEYRSRASLNYHQRVSHGKGDNEASLNAEQLQQIFTCDLCLREYKSKTSLAYHRKTIHGNGNNVIGNTASNLPKRTSKSKSSLKSESNSIVEQKIKLEDGSTHFIKSEDMSD